MRRTIGQTAKLSGVTVRTLHHYDAIGLLRPSGRSGAGYRTYDDADLTRLRQILFYRALEYPLDEIASLLDRNADPMVHLRRQRDRLNARVARLQALAEAVNGELEARIMGIALTAEERFEVFGEFKPEQYAEEVRDRWGHSEAHRESIRRSAGYDKADWLGIKDASSAIEKGFADLLAEGGSPTSIKAMDLAESHRLNMSRWFYDCDAEMHRGLAEMYIADPRFAAHYEEIALGLAQFVYDAIQANANRIAL